MNGIMQILLGVLVLSVYSLLMFLMENKKSRISFDQTVNLSSWSRQWYCPVFMEMAFQNTFFFFLHYPDFLCRDFLVLLKVMKSEMSFEKGTHCWFRK